MRDLPLPRIASFRVLRESGFGREFRKSAGGTLGVLAVLMLIGVLVSAINH